MACVSTPALLGSFPGGWVGILVLVGAAILLGTGMGALSNAIAVLVRREETMIAAANFVLLPLAVWPRLLALFAFLLVCAWLAARAFRVYQRSI